MQTIADRIIAFNRSLEYTGALPEDIGVLHPFRDNPEALRVSSLFYRKYYSDSRPRKLILGINPGRFGAGATGIPFTDPKRLIEDCGIPYAGPLLHEPSSVFIYEVIAAYGGPEAFYASCYIHSICPLGFVRQQPTGRVKNYNYYDDKELLQAALPFIIWNIRQQITIGNAGDTCFCLGTGKNYKFLCALNEQEGFFRSIIPLEHPRFIVQYRQKEKARYIRQYLDALQSG